MSIKNAAISNAAVQECVSKAYGILFFSSMNDIFCIKPSPANCRLLKVSSIYLIHYLLRMAY